MVNSLIFRTLTKTLKFGLPSSLTSSLSYYSTPKFPFGLEEPPTQVQGATEIENKYEKSGKRVKDWPRPSEIPFQAKVANSVNLIGTVRMPVQLVTSPDGNSWAGTIISQDHNFVIPPVPWIPIIFKGDLAYTAATHLKILDNVYVAGHLSPDPLPINLMHERVNVQVVAHDLYFVRGYHNVKKNLR